MQCQALCGNEFHGQVKYCPFCGAKQSYLLEAISPKHDQMDSPRSSTAHDEKVGTNHQGPSSEGPEMQTVPHVNSVENQSETLVSKAFGSYRDQSRESASTFMSSTSDNGVELNKAISPDTNCDAPTDSSQNVQELPPISITPCCSEIPSTDRDTLSSYEAQPTERTSSSYVWKIVISFIIAVVGLDVLFRVVLSDSSNNFRPSKMTQNSTKIIRSTTSAAPSPFDMGEMNRRCTSAHQCRDSLLKIAAIKDRDGLAKVMASVDLLNKPVRGDRKFARTLNSEGLSFFRNGRFAESTIKFQLAIAADPGDEEIASNLVLSLAEEGDYMTALEFTSIALLINARRANLWASTSFSLVKLGRNDEALGAVWLAWLFSSTPDRYLEMLERQSVEHRDTDIQRFSSEARRWLLDHSS